MWQRVYRDGHESSLSLFFFIFFWARVCEQAGNQSAPSKGAILQPYVEVIMRQNVRRMNGNTSLFFL